MELEELDGDKVEDIFIKTRLLRARVKCYAHEHKWLRIPI